MRLKSTTPVAQAAEAVGNAVDQDNTSEVGALREVLASSQATAWQVSIHSEDRRIVAALSLLN